MDKLSKKELIQGLYDLEYSDLVEIKGFVDNRLKALEASMPRPARKTGFWGIA